MQVTWYKLIVNVKNIIILLEERVLKAAFGTVLSLCDLLLDDRELFLKVTKFGAVFRFIIPTLHHNFKDILWTMLRG